MNRHQTNHARDGIALGRFPSAFGSDYSCRGEEKGVRLHWQVAPELPSLVLGDPEKVGIREALLLSLGYFILALIFGTAEAVHGWVPGSPAKPEAGENTDK